MEEKHRDFHYMLDRDLAFGNSQSRAVTCGTASVIVLAANKARKKALFINDSDTVIYLSKGEVAVLNADIRLNANGGSWEEATDSLGYLWPGVFSAISSAATKTLIVIEDI